MTISSSHPPHDPTASERLAGLLDLGFERVDPGPTTVESIPCDDGRHKVTQIRPAMGSFVSITTIHASHVLCEDAIGVAFEEMDRLIGVFNRFDAASPLAYLNDAGRIDGAPPELSEVVRHGLRMGAASDGAFDITVKPIIDLFRDPSTYTPLPEPDAADIDAALELVGPRLVDTGGGSIRLARTGMGLTLDGIAKGYIVDGVAVALAARGVSHYLINAGGDIRTGGDRGDQRPWTIAVRDPNAESPSYDSGTWDDAIVPETVQLMSGAVATSGSYEVCFDSERLAHHIVRSDDGQSPQQSLSVTVTAPTTMEADALATAVFVLGAEQGTRLIGRTSGCECLVIDRNGNQIRSQGWGGAGGQ